jgi:hypothetical protein
MNANRVLIAILLFLAGCGGCQRDDQSPTGAPGSEKAPAAANAAAESSGKIQVAPLQPTMAGHEAAAPRPPAPAAPPAAGEPGSAPAQPEAEDDNDCIVVADANPDYGPPPLAVAFSAEAECSAGQPTYKWDFGDNSPPSTEANPAHTYPKPGDYTATVAVTGPNGATASDEIDITVEEDAEGGTQ